MLHAPEDTLTAADKILAALNEFDYLTAKQATRLLYSSSSLTYVREKLRLLVAEEYALPLAGRSVIMPRVFTPTSKGREHANLFLGSPTSKRFRPSEEQDKAGNVFFIRHTIAVTDILIAARLLAQTIPGIVLTRMYTERSLRRKIYVKIPDSAKRGRGKTRNICIEPDASVEFAIHDKWRDFIHIEVYRHLPMEVGFKQKVQGYVYYAETGQHRALFQTEALTIAVIATTDQQAATLKQWTEEALEDMPQQGQRFFFRSIDTATATPTDLFLSSVWQQAFSEAKSPLLVLEEGHAQ
jgi:hypothetical protein